MADPEPAVRRFRVEDHLGDPEVRRGYEEQSAVLEAARLIRRMREASGLSQQALAEAVGTSQAHLSMLERGVGRHGPTYLMLHRIARACGLRLSVTAEIPAARPYSGAGRYGAGQAEALWVRRVHPVELYSLHGATSLEHKGSLFEGEVVPGQAAAEQAIPLELEAGDRVLFGDAAATGMNIAGEEVFAVKEADIGIVIRSQKESS